MLKTCFDGLDFFFFFLNQVRGRQRSQYILIQLNIKSLEILVCHFTFMVYQKDEADAAAVYEEFVASFEDTQKGGMAKTWVKGGVVTSGEKTSKYSQQNAGATCMYSP